MNYKKIIKDALVDNNPVLVQLIGLCSVLAISINVQNALAMTAAVTFVTTLSNASISLVRKIVPDKIRIPIYVVVIATFVTLVDMFLNAFAPDIYASLGLFIPLIVVNCLILARAESFASKNTLFPSMVDGFFSGLGYGVAITILAIVREIVGSGKLMGITLIEGFQPMRLFAMPPGAFIVLGIMIFIFKNINDKRTKKSSKSDNELISDDVITTEVQ
ncbi:MAG: electron transport complex subunit E [Ezakiella sp.]|nr:electron transport complex subunit E [Ezakiella sp.]MDD7761880.1 electron transport complex subunit E [Bacillota bacterium]MDY3946695.1 electron transport complex subunit E [Ezakiella sp.]